MEFGLELLKKGLIWKVGNGKSVDTWRDNWIPRDYNLKVSPREPSARIRRVDQRMMQHSSNWNENLVKRIFAPEDVDWIQNQKLPAQSCDDILAWHYDRTVDFSVNSAYRLAYNQLDGIRWCAGSSSEHENGRNIWKIISSAKVPSKVKVLGWRVACDNLATKKNKFRRTLELDSTYSICGREEESCFHATVSCTKAKALRWEVRKHWNLPAERFFS